MKKIIIFIIFIIILSGILLGIYFSPLGNDFLKNYIVSKICLHKKFTPVYFNHSFNSFSLMLKNNKNSVQIFGTFFPFSASYNAKITDISSIFPKLKGKILGMGNINIDKITGDLFFAKGKAKLNLKCQNGEIKNIAGNITGKEFDTYCFLKMFKNLPLKNFDISLSGINDLNVNFKKNILITSDFRGKLNILNHNIPVEINNFLNFDGNFFSYKGIINGSDINGTVFIDKNENRIKYLGKFNKINLNIFEKITLLPLKKKVSLNIFYDPFNHNYDFQSKLFSGFFKNNILSIQMNLSTKQFFGFFALPEIINGRVVGNINVSRKGGSFDILIQNALFSRKIFIALNKIINIKFHPNTRGQIFITGKFNSKKVAFDLISKDLNSFWSIKKGIYYYNGKYRFILKFDTGSFIYFFDINNNKIKLLKKINKKHTIETLVY